VLPSGISYPASMPIDLLGEGAKILDRIWMVGCGAMGGALLARWIEAGLAPGNLTVIDPEPRGLPDGFNGAVVMEPAACADQPPPKLVVLAVKPQLLGPVAATLAPLLAHRPLLMSMLAGVRVGTLAQALPAGQIVRIMPNLPARIGQGVTALYGQGLDADAIAGVEALMRAAGTILWLDDESRFDAVTAVSGSGPAFLFRFIEALSGAGEAAGLDPATAARLAIDTVTGAAALAKTSGQAPGLLRQSVTSPGGTTQAGLDVLDGDGALSSLLRATVQAAAERSRALAQAADAATEAMVATARETVRSA
jgi:pyrroline-5-carboxylate reductase